MQKKKKIFQELIPKFPKRLMFSRSVNAWAFYFLNQKGGKGGGGWVKSEFIFIFNPMHELCDMYSTIHHYE